MEKFSFEEVSPPFLPSLGFRSTNNTHIIILNPAQSEPSFHPSFLFSVYSLLQGSDLSYGDSDLPSPVTL